MPRQSRLDTAGALHHVMVRGINKSAIFGDDQDRQKFLERLIMNLKDSNCCVYAWALMNNHVHLLFKSGGRGLSDVMRKQLTWYAMYFNRKYRRTGHLFENRYKSILCEEDRYLLALVRYIHLNPVRVGLVKTIEDLDWYPWTGHSVIMGNCQQEQMDSRYLLSLFGNKLREAQAAYREFVIEGFTQGHLPEFSGGGLARSQGGWSAVVSFRRKGVAPDFDDRVLGSSEFVRRILEESAADGIHQLKVNRLGKSISDVIAEHCSETGISGKLVRSGSRRHKVSQARAAIAKKCSEELGLTLADIARALGVSTSAFQRELSKNMVDN